jgi:hypothetical protein
VLPLRGVGWGVSAPDRRHRASRLAWLGGAVALILGVTLIVSGRSPSQAGPQVAPVAVPDSAARSGAATVLAIEATSGHGSTCGDRPGVPARITVEGARAQNTPVEAHALQDDGTLFVPQDPTVAGWLDYAAVGPGADHGSAVLTTHVNYAHVLGAFSDLTTYRPGQHISLVLTDGRTLGYHVVPAAAMGFPTTATTLVVEKAQLDADPGLRARIFDFTGAWSDDGNPPCGRLVLVTCVGRVVDRNYLDNAFVFALPDR